MNSGSIAMPAGEFIVGSSDGYEGSADEVGGGTADAG